MRHFTCLAKEIIFNSKKKKKNTKKETPKFNIFNLSQKSEHSLCLLDKRVIIQSVSHQPLMTG